MTGNINNKVNWKEVKGVIFDVDGTLYDQRILRIMMMIELAVYALKNRNAIRELKVLHHFRRVREELATSEANNVFPKQFEKVAAELSMNLDQVVAIVERWIYTKPLKYMEISRFDMVGVFFDILRERGLKIGVFSDYPVEEKLIALKLTADATCYSLESGLGKLKPQTLGLETIINRLALNKSECVFIGDRDLRDGICARRLGIPFILRRGRDFYKKMIVEYRNSQVK
jgi:HAD superfamily hydrolase (TIGR01549 family)